MITITEMAEVHASRIAERDAQIASLTEENERLRALLYGQPEPSPLMQQVIEHRNNIGVWRNGNGVPINRTFSAALQPKEGE